MLNFLHRKCAELINLPFGSCPSQAAHVYVQMRHLGLILQVQVSPFRRTNGLNVLPKL